MKIKSVQIFGNASPIEIVGTAFFRTLIGGLVYLVLTSLGLPLWFVITWMIPAVMSTKLEKS